jgi:hypothetical protein
MSNIILVNLTINFNVSDKDHNDKGFYSLISTLSKLKSSQRVLQDSFGKYHYSTIITVKIVIIIMINMAMKLINITELTVRILLCHPFKE